jgi:hypothetical protein
MSFSIFIFLCALALKFRYPVFGQTANSNVSLSK